MRFITTLLALSFLSFNLSSQQTIIGTPVANDGKYDILDANLERYEIYRMNLRRSEIDPGTSSFLIDLELGDRTYKLNLYKGNLSTSFEHPEKPLLLGGSLNTGGTVSLTINDDYIFGFLRMGQTKIYIEPVRLMQRGADPDLFVVYNVEDVIETEEHKCGADLVESKTPRLPDGLKLPTTACKVVDYAIANTFDMIAAHGGTTGVMNFNTSVLNDVQTNYRSEFDNNLEYNVVASYIAASSGANPYEPPTSSTDGSVLLSRFRSWAQGPGGAGGGNSGGATGGFGVDYNMAGVWTDTNFSGGVVGIAYTPGWHHILENYTSSAASLQVMVSHEIGHNWDAVSSSGTGHDPTGSSFIMAPSVNITDAWSTASKSDINARVNSLGYLDACSTMGVPVADFFQSTVATCTAGTVDFEDQSQYGATRSWDFPSGSPLTSTSEKPSVTYNTAGLYGVSITSTNGAGSDTELKYVDVEAAPANPCTTSGSNGTQGITRVRMENLDNTSSTGMTYQDFACSADAILLEPSTSYDMLVTVTGVSRIRWYMDYNADGDFMDPNEDSGLFTFSGNGTLLLTELTPSNPAMGQLIRFRIIVSSVSINSGCTSPSTGEIEDYSFYFEEPQVYGCTDPAASNYDPLATVDDGSCTYGSMTWYEDSDMDTYGNPNVSQTSGSQPPGFVLDNTDCDDTDMTINPGATEICDGVDNNCDGNIDEGVTITFYEDFDSDGFGNPLSSLEACSPPLGYVLDNTDCDDNDPLEFPGQIWIKDFDMDDHGDGTSLMQCNRPVNYYAASELTSIDLDCDDEEPNAYPGNTEVCDGIDNDCDGFIDEGLTMTFYQDMDGDNFGNPSVFTESCTQPPGYVSDNTDCDDNDALEFPGQTWYKDFDGDLYGDGTSFVQCQRPNNNFYAASELTATDTDCNDNDADINPGATEVCDGVDNDCDGMTDEGLTMTFYQDMDNDDFGNPSISLDACSQPAGYVSNSLDCDDSDPLEFPGQTWYKDLDGDMYGDGTTLVQCQRPTDYYVASELTATDTDCDDTDADINPGVSEVCGDGIDNDCDGLTDEGCSLPPCDDVSLVIPVISQNTYRAEIDISSTALANNGQDILFAAGSEILLDDQFEVITGTTFEAKIEPCNNNFNGPENDEVSRSVEIKDIKEIADGLGEYSDDSKVNIRVFDQYGKDLLISRPDSLNMNERLEAINEELLEGRYLILVEKDDELIKFYIQK